MTNKVSKVQDKLNIDDWKNVNQKQFNELMKNLSSLTQSEARWIIKNIPDLSGKIQEYFKSLRDDASLHHKDYLDAVQKHNELLVKLYEKEQDPEIKNKIADSLLEHSRWLRRETSVLRTFRIALSAAGLAIVMMLGKIFKHHMFGVDRSLGRKFGFEKLEKGLDEKVKGVEYARNQ
jgi:hypothetical protein